ncbi:hypothetical protein DAQ1742_03421 [Dickeya aquatica]|uniref:Uncharacterized protein n=1 Tax=Dickeya aquatica TaxID=1401087 RepID=A0A375AF52_9GAMM|nr:hypothetical protein DAQ1742_03421 [Dickeya aquatica]
MRKPNSHIKPDDKTAPCWNKETSEKIRKQMGISNKNLTPISFLKQKVIQ